VAAELLISVELALVAVAAIAVAVVLVGAYGVLSGPVGAPTPTSSGGRGPQPRPRPWSPLRGGFRYAVDGVTSAAVVGAMLVAYPVWYFLCGPGHLDGTTLWTTAVPGDLGNTFGNFVASVGQWGPIGGRQLAAEATALGGYRGPALPSPSYLGIGVVAVVVLGTVWQRRDRRLWLLGGLGVVLAAFSLRSGGGTWGPWALVDHLSLAANVVQSRFSAVIDLCAAAMVAIVVDRVRAVAPRRAAGGWAAPLAALVTGAVAIAPMAAVLAPNLPLQLQPVVVPAWFTSVAPSLPPHEVVLPYPFATADSQSSIPWQAIEGMHDAMPGGGGPAGTVARAGAQQAGFAVLHAASVPLDPAPAESATDLAAVRRAMAAWGVSEVVVPTDAALPAYSRGRGARFAVGFFTAALGSAPVRQADAWVWPRAAAAPRPAPVSAPAFAACTAAGTGGQVARCVLHTGHAGHRAS